MAHGPLVSLLYKYPNVTTKAKNLYVLAVSLPYLGFCSDPKYFFEKTKQNIVKYTERMTKLSENT